MSDTIREVLRIVELARLEKASPISGWMDPSCGSGGLSELVFAADKRGKTKTVVLSAVGLILIGQLLLSGAQHTILSTAAFLGSTFLSFHILEASQPPLVSKLAPGTFKGAAAGVYHTTQSIGLALGGGGRRLVAEGGRPGRSVFHLIGVGVLPAYNRRKDEHAAAQVRKGAAGRWILSSVNAQKETARVIAPSQMGKGLRPRPWKDSGGPLRFTYLYRKST